MAVKVYPQQLDEESRQRQFLKESAAAGRLSSHPGVITVHDAGILPDGRPYLVMDLAPGGSLTRWLQPESRPNEETVKRVGLRIADALATAHAAGVVHCDVKPSNVLIDAYGDVALTDFGLAAVDASDVGSDTRAFHVTPAFAAPEVLRGGPATSAGDVFALGATLYALLAGRPPRDVPSTVSSIDELAAIADQPIQLLSGVNWRLMAALTAALADDPESRPTAAAFRDELAAVDLEAVRRKPLVAASLPNRRTPTTRPVQGRRAAPPLVSAAVATGAVESRRPNRSPARLVPVALLAVLLAGGGAVTAWSIRSTSTAAGTGDRISAGSELPPSTAPTTASSADATAGATDTGAAATQAAAVLDQCRAKVRAGDEVVRQADRGLGHWADHVQAQTEAFAGQISANQLQARFKRTRLAGPADVSGYQKAVDAHAGLVGTCRAPKGAPAEISDALAGCSERAKAQAPVLAAAADGMADWSGHLADMRRSRGGHVHNAQDVWIATWRAAPANIAAWKQARAQFVGPSC